MFDRRLEKRELSTDDLNRVAGGLDEFASSPVRLFALSRRINFDGAGGVSAGGLGSGGGATDMFSLLEGGNPAAGSVIGNGGGASASGGSGIVVPFGGGLLGTGSGLGSSPPGGTPRGDGSSCSAAAIPRPGTRGPGDPHTPSRSPRPRTGPATSA